MFVNLPLNIVAPTLLNMPESPMKHTTEVSGWRCKWGTQIGIQCEVRPGPFSDGFMITFDTVDGPILGSFANPNYGKRRRNGTCAL